MLTLLMVGCAAIAALLILLGAYNELRDLWTHPDHPETGRNFHPQQRRSSRPPLSR